MKPAHFVGSSLDDLRDFPEGAREEAGYAIFLAQQGGKAINAIPMTGFGGAKVIEVVIPEAGDAYRVVYTIKFPEAVYVLHAFQKKAKRGEQTPYTEINVIRQRLKLAETHYGQNYKNSAREHRHGRETQH
jgi:phage-related protein